MKVALPTDDCIGMSPHGPRSGLFLVLEVDDSSGNIINRECRTVNVEHPRHEHKRHGAHEEHETDPEHARWHLAVLQALKDVDVVIAFRMGPIMVEGLQSLGKRVLIGVFVDKISEIPALLKEAG
ncbi:MAG: NifB/NifX family molybdenum-iron cluster-binding protein [Acidilobus sp.]|jgi:predicted Fe-Mo cluster-binding NifX family protein